ncbi:NF-kappa-B inhibitor-interacting Ras-like protein 1 isoform X2 [Hydra vulgaris]|uniref:NF-kappa-B inhibitor-interacting Ras-like protein 1 isoform X2 n=1 Tax=Hydra vulgaris TaxID=6087 RepID=A0ABM4D368_HYDVU
MPPVKSFSKILVLGAVGVGKTSIIEQIVYGNYNPEKVMYSTLEDSYDAWIDADKGQKERIRIYDLKGLDYVSPSLPSHYIQIVDGVMLVFSITSKKSFTLIEQLKSDIEKVRGKDFPIVIVGNKVDLSDSRECDHAVINKWANKEKVKLFEVLPMNRNTLQEPITFLIKKIASGYGKVKPDVKLMFRRTGGKNSVKDADA